MKKLKWILIIVASVFFLNSMVMANGLNLNGFGAKAVAMGGAFVGLADDYTAIHWNPAGIAHFGKKTFGFSGELLIPNNTYKLEMGPLTLVDAKTKSKMYPAFITAYYHPLTENLVAGIGVYTPSGLGAKWDGADFLATTAGSPYEATSYIGVVSVSPAIAYKLSEQVSVGATLNINYGFFKIRRHAGAHPLAGDLGQYDENSHGFGIGATFGVLVKPSEKFSLGATFRTPSKLKMSGDVSISGLNKIGFPVESEYEREVTSPMWLAGGVAFKPMDNLTLTFDLQYTNWSIMDKLESEFTDPAWQGFMQLTGGNELELDWSNKVQIRFGAEYALNNIYLRAGYYYDPAPAPDTTLNFLVPNFDFNVITLGIGYSMNGMNLDCVLEYLQGKDRDIAMNGINEMPGYYTMKLFVPMVSISYGW